MRHRVFISYCEKDQAAAFDICQRIERRGVKCWIAPRDIVVGEDFARRVMDAIEATTVFVLVLSRHTNESHFVKAEAEAAFNYKRPIFPIRLEAIDAEKGLRLFISIRHRVDAFGAGRAAAIDKFVEAVVRRATATKVAAKTAEPPPRADLARWIGPGAGEYLAQWRHMDKTGARFVWAWEAFLGGALWPFYRGLLPMGFMLMLLLALSVAIGGLATRSMDGALTGFMLGWAGGAVFAGLTGSAALRRHVERLCITERPAGRTAGAAGLASGMAVLALAFAVAARSAGDTATRETAIVVGSTAAPTVNPSPTSGGIVRRDGQEDPIAAELQRQQEIQQRVDERFNEAAMREAAAAAQMANVTTSNDMIGDTVTENRM